MKPWSLLTQPARTLAIHLKKWFAGPLGLVQSKSRYVWRLVAVKEQDSNVDVVHRCFTGEAVPP